jgi:hypothetical protein
VTETIDDRIARLRDRYYNSDDKTTSNPGGLGDDGHSENLPSLLADVGLVAEEVGARATLAGQRAASAGVARDAALGALSAVNAANDLALGYRDAAQDARAGAEDARDAAQAAVGGVKVTAADTTAATLNSKVAAGAGLTKAVTSPGGNEGLTLAVDFGTTAGKAVQVQSGGKLPPLDGSDLTNLSAGGGPVSGVTGQQTSGFTLGAAHKNKLAPLFGTFTVTVPSASTLGAAFATALKNEGSGTVTLSGGIAGTLAPGQSLALASDGTTVRKFFDQAGGVERAYFRARSSGSNLNSANYVVIKDLRAFESVDASGTDLAAGKTAIASSNAGTGTEAAKAFDGGTSTYWASSDGSGGSTSPGTPDPTGWVGVNFGAAYAVRSAQVVFYGTGTHLVYGSTIVFEISPDGATWYALASFAVADSTSTAPVVTYTNLQ